MDTALKGVRLQSRKSFPHDQDQKELPLVRMVCPELLGPLHSRGLGSNLNPYSYIFTYYTWKNECQSVALTVVSVYVHSLCSYIYIHTVYTYMRTQFIYIYMRKKCARMCIYIYMWIGLLQGFRVASFRSTRLRIQSVAQSVLSLPSKSFGGCTQSFRSLSHRRLQLCRIEDTQSLASFLAFAYKHVRV